MADLILDRFITEMLFRRDPSELRRFNAQVERARRGLMNLSSLTLRTGLVLTGVGVSAVKSWAQYEKQMSKIEGLVGISREQLEDWQPELDRIGKLTGRGPRELADALFYVTSAGLRGKTAIEVLEESAKASAFGLGETATIVDVVTSAVNAYGEANLSAKEATDSLTEAVRLGKLEPASMASAMGRVLPVASAMGVKFQEVSGMLAAMSRTGTTAEEGVTQLQAIMSQMLKPLDKAKKRYASLGMTPKQVREMVRSQGLFPVLRTLHTAVGGDTAVMAELFGNIRALRGIFDLLGSQIGTNIGLVDEMKDSAGVGQQAFEKYQRTLDYGWRQLVARFQQSRNRVGKDLEPFARDIVNTMSKVLDSFENMDPARRKMIVGLISTGPALLVASAGLRVLATFLSPIAYLMRGIWVASGAMIKGLARTIIWLQATSKAALVAATRGLGTFLSSLRLFVWYYSGLAVASLRRLSVSFLAVIGNPRLLAVQIRAASVAMLGMARAAIPAMIAGLKSVLVALTAILFHPGAWAIGIFAAAVVAAGIMIYRYWEPLKAFFAGFWEGLKEGLAPLEPAFKELQNALEPIVDWFRDLLTPIGEASDTTKRWGESGKSAGRLFGEALVGAVRYVVMFLQWLVETATWAADRVAGAWGAIAETLGFDVPDATAAGRSIPENLAAGITEGTPAVDAAMGDLRTRLGVNAPGAERDGGALERFYPPWVRDLLAWQPDWFARFQGSLEGIQDSVYPEWLQSALNWKPGWLGDFQRWTETGAGEAIGLDREAPEISGETPGGVAGAGELTPGVTETGKASPEAPEMPPGVPPVPILLEGAPPLSLDALPGLTVPPPIGPAPVPPQPVTPTAETGEQGGDQVTIENLHIHAQTSDPQELADSFQDAVLNRQIRQTYRQADSHVLR